ncbi:MAG: hypothetical protein JXR95_04635 [Deltaproteobacteria bacterium]|nr:hypothetical protein [Deltaproteobacteria bacterium]
MLKICPWCLSLEVDTFCGQCSRKPGDSAPMFYLTLGWSRSRAFEKVLAEFEGEEGYSYRELGEEVIHSIPLYSMDDVRSKLKKYDKTLKWKETNLKINSGKEFDSTSGPYNCFVRLMTENQSPCNEKSECPFSPFPIFSLIKKPADILSYIYRDENGNLIDIAEEIPDGALLRLFIADIVSNEDVLMCPVYRSLLSMMTVKVFPEDIPWAHFASDVQIALREGRLLLDSEGNWSHIKPATEDLKYEAIETSYLGPGAQWGTVVGEHELISVDDNLIIMPQNKKVASWPRARSTARTSDGRIIIQPHFNLNEATNFVILDPGDLSKVTIGPFPQPWTTDKTLETFSWLVERKGNYLLQKGRFLWGSEKPVMMVTDSMKIPGDVNHLRVNSKMAAVSFSDNTLLITDYAENTEVFAFQDIKCIEWLNDDELAVLWGNGRRISFIKEFVRSDYYLLVKAREMASTITGNVIITGNHRIMEVSPAGEILDYRHDSHGTFIPSRQGYLHRKSDSVSWHQLDNTVLKDVFPSDDIDEILVVECPLEKMPGKNELSLFMDLVMILRSGYSPEEYTKTVRRLWDEAPAAVRKDLNKLTRAFPWLKNVVKGKSNWTGTICSLEELVSI